MWQAPDCRRWGRRFRLPFSEVAQQPELDGPWTDPVGGVEHLGQPLENLALVEMLFYYRPDRTSACPKGL